MDDSTKQNPISKVIALLLVNVIGAWLMLRSNVWALSKLNSMSAADYVQKQRVFYHHSFMFHFVILVVFGGFYLGAVEFLSYVVGLGFRKRPVASGI
jgi:hypothetical protein